MKLFYAPGACSLAPHIVLRETGAQLALERVDLASHTTASGADFYALTPKGQVPLLQLDDGSVLSEGPVICQYLADQAQPTPLLPPPGTLARLRVLEWQNHITSELHKGFTPLFDAGFDATAKARHRRLLRAKFERIETQLASAPFLTGEAFTVADAYLFVVAGWARHVDLDLSDLPRLQALLTRVAERPAVRETLRAEGLLA